MITRILFCALLLAFGEGAPVERSELFIPNCSELEMDIRWPNYDDLTKYFDCFELYSPMSMQCPGNLLFSFMHQACVLDYQYIPAPPMELLPTEKPPMTLPTPKISTTTTPKATITTVDQEPQEDTTMKKTTAAKTTTLKKTTEATTKTTAKYAPPTEFTGKVTPPTQGPTAKPTTKQVTAKAPNTTTTLKLPGQGNTEAPGYPTPPYINEPINTPPHN